MEFHAVEEGVIVDRAGLGGGARKGLEVWFSRPSEILVCDRRERQQLDLDTADGPTRVFTLLHDARPVLLNLGEPGGFDISPWANRVRLVDAKHDGVWELPVLGEIAAPPAVLIRPDGHVAWAGDLTDPEVPRALATWFGAPTPRTARTRFEISET